MATKGRKAPTKGAGQVCRKPWVSRVFRPALPGFLPHTEFHKMSGEAAPKGTAIDPPEGLHKTDRGQRTNTLGELNATQVKALALILTFCASGLVSVEDMGFVLLSSIYMLILSVVAFPPVASRAAPKVFGESQVLGIYVWIGAVVGLYLPLVYILGGIFRGDKKGVAGAVPHLFLLSCQVMVEGISFKARVNSEAFSLPIRAFVPIAYNTRRIFAISDWMRAELGKGPESLSSARWIRFGRALAVANLMFWSFNLFCFLLPVYLPRAFRAYYEEELSGKDE